MKFYLERYAETTGNIYKSEIEITFSKTKYSLELTVIEKPTKGKFHTRISKLEHLNANNEWVTTKLTNFKKVLANIIPIIIKAESAYVRERLKRAYFKKNGDDFSEVLKATISTWSVDLSKPVSFIEEDLTDEDIKNIIISKKSNNRILRLTVLSSVEDFIECWEKGIIKDEKEQFFQSILSKYSDIFPFIFPGIDSLIKTEYLIDSDDSDMQNKIDLLLGGELKTVIELKRPSTKLFTEKNKRNNMAGISGNLSSSMVQLSLYLKRMKLNAKNIDESFLGGILIIGNDKQFKSDDHHIAWKLFKEGFNGSIYTFSEILERAKTILKKLNN